jgi:hypothetical protein
VGRTKVKDWWGNNSKWFIPTISFIGGLLFGFYIAVLRYESKIETFENNIELIKDNIHDIHSIIQNKVLTK